MLPLNAKLLLVGLLGLVLGGYDSARFSSSTPDTNSTPRDRELLANPPYAQADIPEQFPRHVVDYPYKEPPGTILVNSDARYLYYVLPGGKAVRYGVAVGNEALAWILLEQRGDGEIGPSAGRSSTAMSTSPAASWASSLVRRDLDEDEAQVGVSLGNGAQQLGHEPSGGRADDPDSDRSGDFACKSDDVRQHCVELRLHPSRTGDDDLARLCQLAV